MLSRRLITFFILAAGFSGYMFLLQDNRHYALPLGIAIGLAIMTYVMQYQLNWWWYRRFPPKPDPRIEAMYTRAGAFYQGLSPKDKQEFATRAALFVEAKEFISMTSDDVPEDLRYIVAYYAVALTFYTPHFLFRGYDRVAFYLHPFLSPNYPDQIHTCEVEHTDGTLIYSSEQLSAGFFSPSMYYQTGLHAMAEAFQAKYLFPAEPVFPPDIWSALEEIGGRSKGDIEDFLGLAQEDPFPVIVHHWVAYNTRFNQRLPEVARELRRAFGIPETPTHA